MLVGARASASARAGPALYAAATCHCFCHCSLCRQRPDDAAGRRTRTDGRGRYRSNEEMNSSDLLCHFSTASLDLREVRVSAFFPLRLAFVSADSSDRSCLDRVRTDWLRLCRIVASSMPTPQLRPSPSHCPIRSLSSPGFPRPLGRTHRGDRQQLQPSSL